MALGTCSKPSADRMQAAPAWETPSGSTHSHVHVPDGQRTREHGRHRYERGCQCHPEPYAHLEDTAVREREPQRLSGRGGFDVVGMRKPRMVMQMRGLIGVATPQGEQFDHAEQDIVGRSTQKPRLCTRSWDVEPWVTKLKGIRAKIANGHQSYRARAK
jgi:hypothetical protein